MSTYRVRRLRTVGRGEVARHEGNPRQAALTYASRVAGAVYEVESTELALSLDEIKELLNARKLRSTDLVFVGGRWMPLIEHPYVMEEAALARRHEDRVRLVRQAGLALIAAAIFCAYPTLAWILTGVFRSGR